MCGEFLDQRSNCWLLKKGLFVLELERTCTVCAGEWESCGFNRSHLTPSAVYPRIGRATVTEHQVPLLISDCNSVSLEDTCVTNQLNSTTRCVVRSCNRCCHGNGTVGFLYIVVGLPTVSHVCRYCKCRWVCLHVKWPILLSSFNQMLVFFPLYFHGSSHICPVWPWRS
jgi:hypothetical protein